MGSYLAAEHDADVSGVVTRRVEVCVVANVGREEHGDGGHWQQGSLAELSVVAEGGLVAGEQLAEDGARLGPCRAAKAHELVERRLRWTGAG